MGNNYIIVEPFKWVYIIYIICMWVYIDIYIYISLNRYLYQCIFTCIHWFTHLLSLSLSLYIYIYIYTYILYTYEQIYLMMYTHIPISLKVQREWPLESVGQGQSRRDVENARLSVYWVSLVCEDRPQKGTGQKH